MKHDLLDYLIADNHLKNDAALSKFLGLNPPLISKIRHSKLPIGPSFIIRILEVTDMGLDQVQELAGVESYRDKLAREARATVALSNRRMA